MSVASGEYEKVAQGLYENYLQIKVKDPKMDLVREQYLVILQIAGWLVGSIDQSVGQPTNQSSI